MHELHLKLTDWLPLLPLALLFYVANILGFGFLRVDLPALLILLFCIYHPSGLPLILAFAIGLLQDIVSLAPLGQHAMGLVVLAYVTQIFSDRIRIKSPAKQLPIIFVGLLLVKFVHAWVLTLEFTQLPTLYSVLSVIFTGALWPVVVKLAVVLTSKRPTRRMGLI